MGTGRISYSPETAALVRGIYLGLREARAGQGVVLPAEIASIAKCSRALVSAILNREVKEWTPAESSAAMHEGLRRARQMRWQRHRERPHATPPPADPAAGSREVL